ncbi:hypothetical protein [Bacillus massilioanorexius]|uniref:hypothetical protein n=1 Tax=Bacillus massilioanorexius TaxID=1468413 RepID=UPI000308EA9F|nr:hypothetical protein [Bacillus massilioanorexius]
MAGAINRINSSVSETENIVKTKVFTIESSSYMPIGLKIKNIQVEASHILIKQLGNRILIPPF